MTGEDIRKQIEEIESKIKDLEYQNSLYPNAYAAESTSGQRGMEEVDKFYEGRIAELRLRKEQLEIQLRNITNKS